MLFQQTIITFPRILNLQYAFVWIARQNFRLKRLMLEAGEVVKCVPELPSMVLRASQRYDVVYTASLTQERQEIVTMKIVRARHLSVLLITNQCFVVDMRQSIWLI